MQWSKEQLAAIEARNHTILVSAAAGSGKTAVLVERIVRLLREGASLDRMCICTFTSAAAAEMRERLYRRLSREAGNPAIDRALDDLESAQVSTIHSFCQKLLREEFQAAGLDPNAAVMPDAEKKRLFDKAFRNAVNSLLEEHDNGDFLLLSDCVRMGQLQEWTEKLHGFLMSMPRPFEWAEKRAEELDREPWEDQPWAKILRERAMRLADGLETLVRREKALFEEPESVSYLWETAEKDEQAVSALLGMIRQDPAHMGEYLATFDPGKRKSVKSADKTPEGDAWVKQFDKTRKAVKDQAKEASDSLKLPEEMLRHDLPVVKQLVRGLIALTRRTDETFSSLKRAGNWIDFDDMEQLAMTILEQKDIRASVRSRFDHLFVDECQDVSPLQDAIIGALHGEHCCLFMVGDVKQSIYRFRQADPTLFLRRLRTFPDDENAPERRILLQRNFRSRPNVLDAVNRVFRETMAAPVTELDYLPEDELIPGRDGEGQSPVEVDLVRGGEEFSARDRREALAECLCGRIRETLDQSFTDRDGNTRRYRYRDMVVLMPAVANRGEDLARILQDHGIPTFFDTGRGFFDLAEIRQSVDLLRAVDNPHRDLPLLSALKSPVFAFTDLELARIRLEGGSHLENIWQCFEQVCGQSTDLGERCRAARHELEELQVLSECMPVSEFLWTMFRREGLLADAAAMPQGEQRRANLLSLCQRAAEYEDVNPDATLHGFLEVADKQRNVGDTRSAALMGENDDAVRVMTMHKSKGLEFPAVFLLGLDENMGRKSDGNLSLHNRLGILLPYYDQKYSFRRETPLRQAFAEQRKLDEMAEKARLLYVAMTRAQEKLHLLLCPDSIPDPLWQDRAGADRVYRASSMGDWVMPVAWQQADSTGFPQAGNPWYIRVFDDERQNVVEKEQVIHNVLDWIAQEVRIPASQETVRRLTLPPAPPAAPLKTSVTSLVRSRFDRLAGSDSEEETEEVKAREERIVAPLLLSSLPKEPRFMREEQRLTAAEIGTLTHRALAFTDLKKLEQAADLREEIERQMRDLTDRGVFTEKEAAAVNRTMLVRFYRSPLGKRMMAARQCEREWHFNLRLREEGDVLLQGVIDCAFQEEDDRWVLVDYKTDYVEDEEAFARRYREQLALYARAVEDILGQQVKEKLLYALRLGKAIPVE